GIPEAARNMGLDEPKKMTRKEWRKKKELEEQRKLGNAPAEVDEEGKDINPYIPQCISSVPWYIDTSKRPTLNHERHSSRGTLSVQLDFDYDGKCDHTAKYLRILYPNSAYYDPKSRSMRENPYANAGMNPDEGGYAGDNFARYTGDTISMAQTQLFSWEAYEKGSEVHLQADRTIVELLHKSFKLLLAQMQEYVQYSRYGAVLKGLEKAVAGSKYEENLLINNHTCIWASYWKDGRWGYRCCHSMVKQSYCTGEAGVTTSNSDCSQFKEALTEPREEELPKSLLEMHQDKMVKEKKKKKKNKKNKKHVSDSSDSKSEEKAEEKLKQALEAEDKCVKHVEALMQIDKRKKPYNSLLEVKAPTEEDMEAFHMKCCRPDDPMASFLGQRSHLSADSPRRSPRTLDSTRAIARCSFYLVNLSRELLFGLQTQQKLCTFFYSFHFGPFFLFLMPPRDRSWDSNDICLYYSTEKNCQKEDFISHPQC
uniref:Pre-mRNA-splicing factor SLU7 n=1 Tax=Mola mola TaxID=94237 RepID=A0A3Q3WFX1_MOLML